MADEDGVKKRKLDISWDKMFVDSNDEQELPKVVIVGKKLVPEASDGASDWACADDRVDAEQSLTDRELKDMIERQTTLLLSHGPKMPDKGKKIQDKINRLKDEKERRTLCRAGKEEDGCEKLTHTANSGCSDGPRQENDPSHVSLQSKFAACFSKKLDEKADFCPMRAFEKELQDLGFQAPKQRSVEYSTQKTSGGCFSRKHDPRKAEKGSPSISKISFADLDKRSQTSSPYSLRDYTDGKDCHEFYTKDKPQVFPLKSIRHKKKMDQAVINIEEEESQLKEMAEQAPDLPGCLEEIYYPSRNDPEVVQICLKDMECLSPEGYLNSPIMNFYIRYIQQEASPVNRATCDCHFFNTYFYQKLREAVSHEGNDQDDDFIKFRRWWKGVNLFEKAYILIPIHEDLHWSLVIICIPAKEDESGPIILHLDSLGFHSSKLIFKNIRRFLKEEWNYVVDNCGPLELPIPDKIWRYLPRRIQDRIITVPQQKNDCDCGLFVLFFMERFIEEAPERLRKQDLAMFGRQWFRPEQASGLRTKIRNILREQFQISVTADVSSVDAL